MRPLTRKSGCPMCAPSMASVIRSAMRRKSLALSMCGCYSTGVAFSIELEREDAGRWLAEETKLPGVICYGEDRVEAIDKVKALTLRVITVRHAHRGAIHDIINDHYT